MRAVKVAAVGIMVVLISDSCATLNAQQAKDITDREACQRVKTLAFAGTGSRLAGSIPFRARSKDHRWDSIDRSRFHYQPG